MGMDVFLVRYKGKDEFGCLKYDWLQHPRWDDRRFTVRKRFMDEVEFDEVCSDRDLEGFSRPKNFDNAYKWASSLETADRKYIENMLEILQEDEMYYLEFHW